MRLKDKIAIVTGGAQGFGEGIARRFAEEGAAVMVADINDEPGRRVVADIVSKGGKAAYRHSDVTKDADWATLVRATIETFGGLTTCVNNAGTTHRNQPMLDVSEEMFDRIYAVNVKSLYHSAKHCVPAFRQAGGGVFVNIASTAGVRPRPGLTWYNGSKGAVIILTKSMAAELAPKNIRVNAINPVIGETGMLEQFMGMPDTPANRARFLATIPLGRMSKPEDIANAALFLADPASSFITGIAIEVDGGRCI